MNTFPFHRQQDFMQNGIACLQMICEYWGQTHSRETIEDYYFCGIEKSAVQNLTDAGGKSSSD